MYDSIRTKPPPPPSRPRLVFDLLCMYLAVHICMYDMYKYVEAIIDPVPTRKTFGRAVLWDKSRLVQIYVIGHTGHGSGLGQERRYVALRLLV